MDYKKTILRLLISLLVSPLIVYLILIIARASGADYDMTHGETWIIWILMAILINNAMVYKKD